jgi:SWI/SNF-related matrix-associated actin-dependent regulator 1 of chromatin subfamily A
MGLGKTAQIIAFMASLKERGDKGPHLIVVPASLVDNWARELSTWCPNLTFEVYRGNQTERHQMRYSILARRSDLNVLLCTYNTAVSTKDDRVLLRKMKFKSIILDEGHFIKNQKSMRFKHLMSIKAPFRLIVTGTPLQNDLSELYALLKFVLPEHFQSAEVIELFNSKPSDKEEEENRLQLSRKILRPFILQRTKQMVLQELPPKIQAVEECQCTPLQRSVYNQIVASFLETKRIAFEGKENYTSRTVLYNLCMQLRKVANHPLLLRTLFSEDHLTAICGHLLKTKDYRGLTKLEMMEELRLMSDFDIHVLCGKYSALEQYRLPVSTLLDCGKIQALRKILPARIAAGDKILMFSQFVILLDILEPVLESMGIKFLRFDGQVPATERQEIIDQFHKDDEIKVLLLSTKAGGVGLNLTCANTVIIYDIGFNPHNDAQAENRAHRVGQTKPVTIIRFLLKGTVEERILQLAQNKLELDHKMRKTAPSEDLEMNEEEMEQWLFESLLQDPMAISL